MNRVRSIAVLMIWMLGVLAVAPVPRLALAQDVMAEEDDDAAATWVEPDVMVEEDTGSFLSDYRPAGSDRVRSNDDLEATWFSSAVSLEDRVKRTRVAALLLGVRNLEHIARALIESPPEKQRLEAAHYAVSIAPDLPAAHMALARALWSEKGFAGIVEALEAGFEAIRASDHNLYSSLLMSGILMYVLSIALVVGALLYITISSFWVLPHAVHDIGDTFRVAMPAYARAAVLASILLFSPVLGEGWLGLALGGFGLVFCYGSIHQRVAISIAAILLLLGIHPIAETAGRNLVALGLDPNSQAAYRTEYSLPTQTDVIRLQGIEATDPLVARALAIHTKREGDLEGAKQRYEAILAEEASDPEVLNNAANVLFAMGDLAGAIDYYERAASLEPSAPLLFNLSQAYGAAIEPDQQSRALADAQALDPELVQEIMELRPMTNKNIALHIPVSIEKIRKRLFEQADGREIGRVFRSSIAPGRLSSMWLSVVAFVFVAVLSGVLSRFFECSFWCQSCHRSCCPHCEAVVREKNLCESCDILYNRPELTDKAMREKRISELRRIDKVLRRAKVALTVLVPGLGGLMGRRFILALIATFIFSGAVVGFSTVSQIVPDPMITGGTEVFLLSVAATVFLTVYGLLLLISLRSLRSR